MNKRILGVVAVALASAGVCAGSTTTAQADDPTTVVSKTGKETFCRSKIKLTNMLDQTIQLEKLRLTSSEDAAFFSEYDLKGSGYRPVTGATVSTPVLDVMVPAGHKYKWKITFRKQITAGPNPSFSAPKTVEYGAGAIQPACALDGATFGVNVRE